MKLIRAMLLLAAVIATSVTARAAISSAASGTSAFLPRTVQPSSPGSTESDSAGCQAEALSSPVEFGQCGFEYGGFAGLRNDLLLSPYASALRGKVAHGLASDPAPHILELPAPPSSASLLLSGLLTIGALRMCRCAKNIHLAALPDWYHEACPQRIGHTVAFDFDLADMPVCFTADIAATDIADNTPVFHEYLRESRSRVESQFILPVIAPRGPPAIA